MKLVNKLKDRKGVSPVIATVILVAITITVAVAVAYWMSGIAGQYTQFEKIEIQSAICTYSNGNWTIDISLKNTGTATATLISAFINDVEVDVYDATAAVSGKWATNITLVTNTVITSGQSMTILFWIDSGKSTSTLSSGTTVNIKIHSAGGMDYIRLVQLT